MVVLFAILGALAIGLLIGLTWRGFVLLGDRRELGMMVEQLNAEHRITMATNQALAQMRRIVRDATRTPQP